MVDMLGQCWVGVCKGYGKGILLGLRVISNGAGKCVDTPRAAFLCNSTAGHSHCRQPKEKALHPQYRITLRRDFPLGVNMVVDSIHHPPPPPQKKKKKTKTKNKKQQKNNKQTKKNHKKTTTTTTNQPLLGESINRGPVCAHLHSIARTQKILTFIS